MENKTPKNITYVGEEALWAWTFSNIYQVKGFLGPSCCEKQVSNDNI